MHTRVVGIIRYIVYPYSFSSNGISVKAVGMYLYTLLSLLPLYMHNFFTCHPYFTLQLFFIPVTILFFSCSPWETEH